jgi:hypothetical protein
MTGIAQPVLSEVEGLPPSYNLIQLTPEIFASKLAPTRAMRRKSGHFDKLRTGFSREFAGAPPLPSRLKPLLQKTTAPVGAALRQAQDRL